MTIVHAFAVRPCEPGRGLPAAGRPTVRAGLAVIGRLRLRMTHDRCRTGLVVTFAKPSPACRTRAVSRDQRGALPHGWRRGETVFPHPPCCTHVTNRCDLEVRLAFVLPIENRLQ